jgi:hypothetical protein
MLDLGEDGRDHRGSGLDVAGCDALGAIRGSGALT